MLKVLKLEVQAGKLPLRATGLEGSSADLTLANQGPNPVQYSMPRAWILRLMELLDWPHE